MAIIHIKLTKEHIALIRAMMVQEDGDDVMYVNKNYLFGGTHIMEDLTDILGFHDKFIKGTEENPNGKAFPDDVEKHCMEIYTYIKDNFFYIINLIFYYATRGGISEGEYKCKDNDLIWEKVN